MGGSQKSTVRERAEAANWAADFRAKVKETTEQVSQAAKENFNPADPDTYDAAIDDALAQMGRR